MRGDKIVGFIFSLLSVRFLILFSENIIVEYDQRDSDEHLRNLCKDGAASASSRFRNTCLELKTSEATPVFVKALLTSILNLSLEFKSMLFDPFVIGSCAICLFLFYTFYPILELFMMSHYIGSMNNNKNDVEYGAYTDRRILLIENNNNNVPAFKSKNL